MDYWMDGLVFWLDTKFRQAYGPFMKMDGLHNELP